MSRVGPEYFTALYPGARWKGTPSGTTPAKTSSVTPEGTKDLPKINFTGCIANAVSSCGSVSAVPLAIAHRMLFRYELSRNS